MRCFMTFCVHYILPSYNFKVAKNARKNKKEPIGQPNEGS